MKNLLIKEFKLATPLLTYLFIGFALMTFIPGYPILCGTFFVCMGIFQGYQINKDSNDILYSILLPVSKKEVVKAKYMATVIIQAAAFVICVMCTLVRMMFLSNAKAYTTNVLMGANLVYLGFILLTMACFNAIFLGGFFKTAYGIGKPFVTFIVVNFIIIGIAETLHHIPGLRWMGTLGFDYMLGQVIMFLGGLGIYIAMTAMSYKKSCIRFEMLDM